MKKRKMGKQNKRKKMDQEKKNEASTTRSPQFFALFIFYSSISFVDGLEFANVYRRHLCNISFDVVLVSLGLTREIPK